MSVSEGTAPRISGPKGEERAGGEVGNFVVPRLVPVGLVSVGRLGVGHRHPGEGPRASWAAAAVLQKSWK